MVHPKAKILVVDDEQSIRWSMAKILTEIGYQVRCAADGFSALLEMRSEIPDLIVSDLNMPGMLGFELLSVVRRRFPAINVIAMSGAFSGSEVPSGVAADAFYEKGSSVRALLQLIESLPWPERMAVRSPGSVPGHALAGLRMESRCPQHRRRRSAVRNACAPSPRRPAPPPSNRLSRSASIAGATFTLRPPTGGQAKSCPFRAVTGKGSVRFAARKSFFSKKERYDLHAQHLRT